MSAFRVILTKDLRVELRTLQSVPAMALFALSTFVLFRFGLDRESLEGSLAAGVILATVLFAAILAINRLFVAEREEGGFDAIRLAPVDPASLFAAKAVALIVYLALFELLALAAFAFLFLDSLDGLPALALVLLLTDIGLAAIGVIVSAIGANSRARELIVPLLLLPFSIPLMIAAAGIAGPALDLDSQGVPLDYALMLVLYDAVFLAIGYAVYDFLLED